MLQRQAAGDHDAADRAVGVAPFQGARRFGTGAELTAGGGEGNGQCLFDECPANALRARHAGKQAMRTGEALARREVTPVPVDGSDGQVTQRTIENGTGHRTAFQCG